MTPLEFRRVRRKLGLSNVELHRLIDVAEVTLKRYQMPPARVNARPIPKSIALLMQAMEEGFRPAGWKRVTRQETEPQKIAA